tara:strand:+ start:731 stop:1093 length:363 start_codon:yes stop_codon:yes gene_type:complete
MSIAALRSYVRSTLDAKPNCEENPIGETSKLIRYLVDGNKGFGFEPRGTEHLNIWVEERHFDPAKWSGSAPEVYKNIRDTKAGGNSSVLHTKAFFHPHLIRLKALSKADADAAIEMVAGR